MHQKVGMQLKKYFTGLSLSYIWVGKNDLKYIHPHEQRAIPLEQQDFMHVAQSIHTINTDLCQQRVRLIISDEYAFVESLNQTQQPLADQIYQIVQQFPQPEELCWVPIPSAQGHLLVIHKKQWVEGLCGHLRSHGWLPEAILPQAYVDQQGGIHRIPKNIRALKAFLLYPKSYFLPSQLFRWAHQLIKLLWPITCLSAGLCLFYLGLYVATAQQQKKCDARLAQLYQQIDHSKWERLEAWWRLAAKEPNTSLEQAINVIRHIQSVLSPHPNSWVDSINSQGSHWQISGYQAGAYTILNNLDEAITLSDASTKDGLLSFTLQAAL